MNQRWCFYAVACTDKPMKCLWNETKGLGVRLAREMNEWGASCIIYTNTLATGINWRNAAGVMDRNLKLK